MEILKVPYGPLSSNMYIVTSEEAVFIIDPSVDPERINTQFDLSKLSGIFITHAHFDHIYAIEKYIEMFPDVPVYMSAEDILLLGNSSYNCFDMVGINKTFDFNVEDARFFNNKPFANFYVTSYITPGHTIGSLCYLFTDKDRKYLFSGDTLFKSSMGRTDFPTGNDSDMMNSLNMLSKLDKSIIVFPGHGPSTTIGDEVNNNPYFF